MEWGYFYDKSGKRVSFWQEEREYDDAIEPVVHLFWTRDTTAASQYITWSESPDFADAITQNVPIESASFEIYNLIPNRRYYCKVTAEQGQETTTLANFSFTTAGQMRHLKAEGTANVRDIGGWHVANGKQILYGKIYRGAEWNGRILPLT